MKVGTEQLAREWEPNDVIISVEMGFGAESTKSCGLYRKQHALGTTAPTHESFGTAVRTTSEWLAEAGGRAALIMEAPLSFFWRNGSPCPRLDLRGRNYSLERRRAWKKSKGQSDYKLKTETRYWYVAPGSTVALAACLFLRRLFQIVPSEHLEAVYLFEGFASFKGCGFDDRPPADGTTTGGTHAVEAVALADALHDASDLDPEEHVVAESILDAMGICETEPVLPAVVDAYPGEAPERH